MDDHPLLSTPPAPPASPASPSPSTPPAREPATRLRVVKRDPCIVCAAIAAGACGLITLGVFLNSAHRAWAPQAYGEVPDAGGVLCVAIMLGIMTAVFCSIASTEYSNAKTRIERAQMTPDEIRAGMIKKCTASLQDMYAINVALVAKHERPTGCSEFDFYLFNDEVPFLVAALDKNAIPHTLRPQDGGMHTLITARPHGMTKMDLERELQEKDRIRRGVENMFKDA